MTWIDEQARAENLEDYQNYLITQELKGSMTPTLEEVIRLLKGKGVNNGMVKKTNGELYRG